MTGGLWTKGQSGNPAGKPKGTRNHNTRAMEALLDGESEALTRKAIDLALLGDTTALRLCLERILPPRKGRSVVIDLPEDMTSAKGLADAQVAVLTAMGRGEISIDEAADVARVLDGVGAAYERRELEARIIALEGKAGTK